MKKIYFFLASVLMAFCANAAATQLYLIGDPVEGGWSYQKGIEMTSTGEAGVFTLSVSFDGTKWFGFTENIGTSWDATNGARYGATSKDATPVEGENAMLFPSENAWKLPAGEYTFTVNTNTKKFILGGAIDDKMGDLYLRGMLNDWLNEGLDATYKFSTADEKIYTLNVAALGAGEVFKIGTADWGYSFSSGDIAMTVGTPYSYEGMNEDMAMADNVANVTITLNLNDKTITVSGQASVTSPASLYLIGDVKDNHWIPSTPVEMTKNGNVFTLTKVEIETAFDNEYGFFSFCTAKGADAEDWAVGDRYGASVLDEEISVGVPAAFVRGENAWKVRPAVYNVTVDFDTKQVTLTKGSSAIETVAAADVEEAAVYFNLQGVRVLTPEAGALYIVKRGDKVSKEIVR